MYCQSIAQVYVYAIYKHFLYVVGFCGIFEAWEMLTASASGAETGYPICTSCMRIRHPAEKSQSAERWLIYMSIYLYIYRRSAKKVECIYFWRQRSRKAESRWHRRSGEGLYFSIGGQHHSRKRKAESSAERSGEIPVGGASAGDGVPTFPQCFPNVSPVSHHWLFRDLGGVIPNYQRNMAKLKLTTLYKNAKLTTPLKFFDLFFKMRSWPGLKKI